MEFVKSAERAYSHTDTYIAQTTRMGGGRSKGESTGCRL
jgi:hypothetical protein